LRQGSHQLAFELHALCQAANQSLQLFGERAALGRARRACRRLVAEALKA
jgi:hypothetical protein